MILKTAELIENEMKIKQKLTPSTKGKKNTLAAPQVINSRQNQIANMKGNIKNQVSLGIGLNNHSGINETGNLNQRENSKIYEKNLNDFQKQNSRQDKQHYYMSSGSLNDQRFPAIKINGEEIGMIIKKPSTTNLNGYEYEYTKTASPNKENEVSNSYKNHNFLKNENHEKAKNDKKLLHSDDEKWQMEDVPEDPEPSLARESNSSKKIKTLSEKNTRVKNPKKIKIKVNQKQIRSGEENVSSENNEYMELVPMPSLGKDNNFKKVKNLKDTFHSREKMKNGIQEFGSPFPISKDLDDSYDIKSQPSDKNIHLKIPQVKQRTISKQIDYCLPQNNSPSSLRNLHGFTASRNLKMNQYSDLAKISLEKYTKEIESIFKKNEVPPQGPFLCKDGSTYIGQIDSEGYKDGLGEEIDQDGSGYRGEFKKNVRYGKGRFVSSNGLHYYGGYINGIATGKGTLSCDLFVYNGEFDDSLMHGQGELIYADGTKFVGTMDKNVKTGPGSLSFFNGTTYVGDFEDDEMKGYGKKNIFFIFRTFEIF